MLKHALAAAAALLLLPAAPALAADSSGQTGNVRTATSECPAGEQIYGGDGGIEYSDPADHIVITEMIPVHPLTGNDRYIVSAYGPSGGDWRITATAYCGKPIAGWHIVIGSTILSSATWHKGWAYCPTPERVIGSGGWVLQPTAGQVAIQMKGVGDGSGTFVNAQAHEDADGYAGDWNVLAYAVCAPKPKDYAVATHDSPDTSARDYKGSNAACPEGTYVIDVGGGAAFDAPGSVSLYRLLDLDHGRSGEANTAENSPTSTAWKATGSAICEDL
jgi:hypothetical protein